MTGKNWIIRRANLSDTKALKACAKVSCGEDEQLFDFESEITENPVWIAEYNNQLIGCVILHLSPENIHVEFVMVKPEFRDQGLGRFLMEFSEQEALKRKCDHITIVLDSKHKSYLSLYEHLGWVIHSEVNENTIMKKNLEMVTEEA